MFNVTPADNYTEGDKVEYLNWETNDWETATVTGTGEHHERPTIFVKLANGDDKFGYEWQVRPTE